MNSMNIARRKGGGSIYALGTCGRDEAQLWQVEREFIVFD